MDCLEAQELISAAFDGEPLDSGLLEQARNHCLECSACWAFMRTQLTIHGMPLPEPPDDLADRAIAAAYAAAAEETDPDSAAVPLKSAPPATAVASASRRRWFSTRTGQWIAAAAAVLLVAGVVGVPGVISSMHGNASRTATSTSSQAEKSAAMDSSAGASAASSSADSYSGSAEATRDGSAPDVVTFVGVVYASAGMVATDSAGLHEAGYVTTSLDSTSEAKRRTVYAGADNSRIFVAVESQPGALLAFQRVTRVYAGATYALTSADVSHFGTWPSLPESIPAPTNADGSPTFALAGKDDSGVAVYKLSSADVSVGIAVAPGTAAADPAGGNPNWTWWEPLR